MFSQKTVKFLSQLKKNNNRDWFKQHQDRYEAEVRAPAFEYIEAMKPVMAGISPHFIVEAKKTGGSLMRVHRDTRFGSDKTPYKTNVGIQFRHAAGKDVHAPGFYLHLEPGSAFLGAGIWRPDTPTLTNVRTLMDEYPDEWAGMLKKVCARKQFSLHGDSLKRPPRGYSAEHPLIEDLKRKDIIAVAEFDTDKLYGKGAVQFTARLFTRAAPLVEFICNACDHNY